ncbi:FAD-dependent monooxygenase [uncultured Sphingomonas sp.]|uniref:FAD-dependent monooxygenase n=1 Tax=uncultured Sphingomonas sp. TaxID=158754 RepID=UPI0035CB79F5
MDMEADSGRPRTEVVVVGAGPSGLALSIELGQRGIRCLVVEQNERVGYAPRAKTTNVRTRTHFRRWGIAERLAEVSPFGVDYPSNVHFVTSLRGASLAVIENASNCAPVKSQDYPEHGQWVPQYKLEQVLREKAGTLPSVAFRFGTEFVAADQDEEKVMITLRDRASGIKSEVVANTLVGADGARSAVRSYVGATMSGTYGLSRNYNIVFRAPGLADAHAHGPGSMYWQVNPVAPGLIGPMDEGDIWFFMPTRLPEDFKITQDSAAALIRQSTGIDLPYEIMSSDEWVASSLLADRYRDRRAFLIGDACHLHPPFGGYGMNMGIADGVDLGWKIAAVSRGWGGAGLLDSYERERRPIHESIIAEASANHSVLSNDLWHPNLERDDAVGEAAREAAGLRIVAAKEREFHTLGIVLGDCYTSSPIIEDDGSPVPTRDALVHRPTSRPGCLAPHFWCGGDLSLYDCFGMGFALVCRPEARSEEIEQATSDARSLDMPFVVVRLQDSDPLHLYPSTLTLVRPDQHVAWRGARWSTDALQNAAGLGSQGSASDPASSSETNSAQMRRDEPSLRSQVASHFTTSAPS